MVILREFPYKSALFGGGNLMTPVFSHEILLISWQTRFSFCKTSSGMAQLPNDQYPTLKGFFSATHRFVDGFCWLRARVFVGRNRRKSKKQTETTRCEKLSTKRNLESFLTEWWYSMFWIYWTWLWHYKKQWFRKLWVEICWTRFTMPCLPPHFSWRSYLTQQKTFKNPAAIEDRYKLLGIKHFATRMVKNWSPEPWLSKEWSFSMFFP